MATMLELFTFCQIYVSTMLYHVCTMFVTCIAFVRSFFDYVRQMFALCWINVWTFLDLCLNCVRYIIMFELCQIYIFTKFEPCYHNVRSMFQLCLYYVNSMFELCQLFVWTMPVFCSHYVSTCLLHMHRVCAAINHPMYIMSGDYALCQRCFRNYTTPVCLPIYHVCKLKQGDFSTGM